METADERLIAATTAGMLVEEYRRFKQGKWDRRSDIDDPKIDAAMGADGVDYSAFERELERNCTNIASRISSGKYFFYAVREIDIKKDPGRELVGDNIRTIGVSSIRDVLVQRLLYREVLRRPLEELFASIEQEARISYAYRSGLSAPRAALRLARLIDVDGYRLFYDADIRSFFDEIQHDILLQRLGAVLGPGSDATLTLVRRFLSDSPERT